MGTIADLDSEANWVKQAHKHNKKSDSKLGESKKIMEEMVAKSKAEQHDKKQGEKTQEKKKIVSDDAALKYEKSLQSWVSSKLQRYSTDSKFRSSRDKKYGSKEKFKA